MSASPGRFVIGTSGWHYAHWRGPFYPAELKPGDYLAYYARHFQAVESNNTFYGLPKEATVEAWRETTPEGFVFAVKANRLITHRRKLLEPETTLHPFLERAALLGPKLGPILFQLPPGFALDAERLEAFLPLLPPHRYAFEFRNPTWFTPRVERLLQAHGAAACFYDFDGRQSPEVVTADFVYVRLHGPDGPYRGRYAPEALAAWAAKFEAWAERGLDVYCFFDNDELAYAPYDAQALMAMLAEEQKW